MTKINNAIIMAAGMGTRMRPLTNETPKPLVKVNGIRMIESIIQALHQENVTDITVVTGYLADKFDQLIPTDIQGRTETLNWLFWQIGSGPYVGGGFGHFFAYAPEPMKYPIDRFTMETKRQLDLLDKTLAKRPYIAGESYTIADIAIWSWYGQLALGELYEGSYEFLNMKEYPHLLEWSKKIAQRPGVKRGLEIEYQSIKE